MKQKYLHTLLLFIFATVRCTGLWAQGMHFSQYYNAPMLLNPANAALMPDNDFRVGANFRSQWATIPVPYTTASIYGDCQVLRNKNQTNWMGLGFAFFNDNAGDGKLNLFRSDLILAYHIQLGRHSMVSGGAAVSYGQRSVNFSLLTYPVQWDGTTFNPDISNKENKGLEKTSYATVAAGLNYAYFPSENIYLKVSGAVANINRPTESFMSGSKNQLDYRPSANIDLLLRSSETLIINPSAYYSTESGAYEMVYGTLLMFGMRKPFDQIAPNQFIIGAFHRWGDAVIAAVGIERNGFRAMASYDYTISTLSPNTNGMGAFEISLKYEGIYTQNSRGRRSYHCPRF